jgi:hypothetical protein
MDDDPSGQPSEEAQAQRLETVIPIIWIMVGTLVVFAFIAAVVGVGRPVARSAFHAPPPATIVGAASRR